MVLSAQSEAPLILPEPKWIHSRSGAVLPQAPRRPSSGAPWYPAAALNGSTDMETPLQLHNDFFPEQQFQHCKYQHYCGREGRLGKRHDQCCTCNSCTCDARKSLVFRGTSPTTVGTLRTPSETSSRQGCQYSGCEFTPSSHGSSSRHHHPPPQHQHQQQQHQQPVPQYAVILQQMMIVTIQMNSSQHIQTQNAVRSRV